MLGIDLYKEVLLNGSEYEGRKYKSKDGEIYTINKIGKEYLIFEQNSPIGVINLNAHENGIVGIHEFMLSELEEVKQEVEMVWQECLVKYIENPEKYYMKAINKDGIKYEFDSKTFIGFGLALPMPITFIKSVKWFLCER